MENLREELFFDETKPKENTEIIDPKLAEELKKDAEIRNPWSESIHSRDQRQTFNKINEIYDFIIVGAGTAGCVLARELIYNIPNINILVLEAGPPDIQVNDRMRLPCAWLSVSLNVFNVIELITLSNHFYKRFIIKGFSNK